MTELEYKIENLEIQIRTVARSIARPKSARQKAADVVTLARLQKELDALKQTKEDEEYLQSCIDAAAPAWKGVDAQEFMDMVRGREPQNESDE